MTYKFRGVCPVINVPFFPDERIDYATLAREIDYTIAQKVESICVFARLLINITYRLCIPS